MNDKTLCLRRATSKLRLNVGLIVPLRRIALGDLEGRSNRTMCEVMVSYHQNAS